MTALTANFNKLTAENEMESKAIKDPYQTIPATVFTKKASVEQINLRNLLLKETTIVLPNPCKPSLFLGKPLELPPLEFSLQEIALHLTKSLRAAENLAMGPFFIGGVATDLILQATPPLLQTTQPLTFSDLDVCFYLNVPDFTNIQYVLEDFLRLHLTILATDPLFQKNYLWAFLQSKEANSIIAANYLYKRAKLTNQNNFLGGSFFKLGLFEFKFFFKTICRQNVFLSDGFRFPLFEEEIFCMNVDEFCTEREFDLAVAAADTRQCLVSKPKEISNFLFKLAQKATQGYELPQADAITSAWEQFSKTFLREKAENLGLKLCNHHLNHYPDSSVGKLFDFMNFLIFIRLNSNAKERVLQCAIFAKACLSGAHKKDQNDLLGTMAKLVGSCPEKSECFLLLIQGFLLHQLVKKNPIVSGYLFDFDRSHLRYALAVNLSDRTHYLQIQNSPKILAQKFLASWLTLEAESKEIQLLLTELLAQFGFGRASFSHEFKKSVVQDLFENLENFSRDHSLLQENKFAENYTGFYQFLLENFGSLLNRPQLEIKLLESRLAPHLKEAKGFREEALEKLILSVLKNFKASNPYNLAAIMEELRKLIHKRSYLSPFFKSILAEALLKILLRAGKNPKQLFTCATIATLSNQLKIFNPSQENQLFHLLHKKYDNLLRRKDFICFRIVFTGLLEIQQWINKSEEIEKQQTLAFIKLSDQISASLEKLMEGIPLIPLTQFRMAGRLVLMLIDLRFFNAEFDSKVLQETIQKLTEHAFSVKSPSLLHVAGSIGLKALESKMTFQREQQVLLLNLAEKLLGLSSKDIDAETSLDIYTAMGGQILRLLETCDGRFEWQQSIQMYFIKRMAEALFAKTLPDFEKTINNRQRKFSLFLKIFTSLSSMQLQRDKASDFQKLAHFNFLQEHAKIRNSFLHLMMEFDCKFSQKILKTCSKELLSEEEIFQFSNFFIEKPSEGSLDTVYEVIVAKSRSPKEGFSLSFLNTILDLLSAYSLDEKMAVEKVHFLVDLFCLLLKNYHDKKEEWEKGQPDDLHRVQKKFVHTFNRFLSYPSLPLLRWAELLIISERKLKIVPQEVIEELFFRLLNQYKIVADYPSTSIVDFYLESLSEMRDNAKYYPLLPLQISRLIALCLEKKQEAYGFLAFYLFQKSLQLDLRSCDKEYASFFSALIRQFPTSWNDPIICAREVKIFIQILIEKNFLEQISPKEKIAFLQALLSLSDCPLNFIWEQSQHIHSMPDEMIKLCQDFCQKAKTSKNSNGLLLSLQMSSLLKKPDPLVCLHILESFSLTADVKFFEFAYKHIFKSGLLEKAELFSPSQKMRGMRHLLQYIINLTKHSKKLEEEKIFFFYLEIIGELWQVVATWPWQEEPEFKILSTQMITFFTELDEVKYLLLTLDILNEKSPLQPSDSFFEILNGLLRLLKTESIKFDVVKDRLKKLANNFFKTYPVSFSNEESEIYLAYFRKFFDPKFPSLEASGFIFLEALFDAEVQQYKLKGLNKQAPYPQKIQRNIRQHLLRMGEFCIEQKSLTELFKIAHFAIDLVSEKYQRGIINLLEKACQPIHDGFEALGVNSKNPKAIEVLVSLFPCLRELINCYARFDASRGQKLVEQYVYMAQEVNPLENSQISIAAHHLLTECLTLQLFEKKTLSLGKTERLKGEALRNSLKTRNFLISAILARLCQNPHSDARFYALSGLKICRNFTNFSDVDQVTLLVQLYAALHEVNIFYIMKDHDEKTYKLFFEEIIELFNREFNFLEFSYSPLVEILAMDLLLYPFLMRLVCEKAALQFPEKSMNEGVNLFMDSPALLEKLLPLDSSIDRERLIKRLPDCLLPLRKYSESEKKRAIDPQTQRLLTKLLIALLDEVSKAKFIENCPHRTIKKFMVVFQELKHFSQNVLPPPLAQTVDSALKRTIDRIAILSGTLPSEAFQMPDDQKLVSVGLPKPEGKK